MDKNTQEQVRVVAEYNGWELCQPLGVLWERKGKLKMISELKYDTSFDWLIPVAKKVVDDLNHNMQGWDLQEQYEHDCWQQLVDAAQNIIDPVTIYDITLLFPAVVEAIELLKKYKTKP